MMQDLFTIGENNMVQLNKIWISMVPEFRVLLARDKGGPGDGSGKYKKKATREFTYIYHLLDMRGPLENYDNEERKRLAREFSQLEDDKADELEKDEDFIAAMDRYQDFVDNASSSLQTLRDMKMAKHSMNKFLRTVDFTRTTDTGALRYDVGKIQTAIIAMPKLEAAIHEMEVKVKMEVNDILDMRGGAEKGGQEDPDDDD